MLESGVYTVWTPMCPDVVKLFLAGRYVTIVCVDGLDLAECVRTLCNNF